MLYGNSSAGQACVPTPKIDSRKIVGPFGHCMDRPDTICIKAGVTVIKIGSKDGRCQTGYAFHAARNPQGLETFYMATMCRHVGL